MTRDDFLQSLVDSKLLSPEQLETVRASVQPDGTAVAAAERVVKSGVVTPWQAQQLLARRTRLYLGRYKLMRSLGQGGMGAVFQAEQTTLRRIVAVKVIAPNVLQDADAVQRFLREIRTVAALHHSNIVEAYDADRVGQTYFFAMEYVPGADLKTWIRRQGRLPIDWSCEVARQTALGLQHAFENGLVHRDIKPANILIAQAMDPSAPFGDREIPRVKILDLGLARFTSDKHTDATLTQSGQIMGTPDYISPEQAENTRFADIRADLYSLGCTLFESLTGRVPFLGESAMQKILARMRYDPPRVRVFRPEVPQGLDDLVARLMARDPAARPQTPQEAARLLEPFSLSGQAAVSPTIALPLDAPSLVELAEGAADHSLDTFRTALSDHVAAPTPGPFEFSIDAARPAAGSGSNRGGSGSVVRPPWMYSRAAIAAVVAGLVVFVGLSLWMASGGSADRVSTPGTTPKPTGVTAAVRESSPKLKTDLKPFAISEDRGTFGAFHDDANVAKELLRKGAWVHLHEGGGAVRYDPGTRIPAGPVSIHTVELAKGANFFSSDMKLFSNLPALEGLRISEVYLGQNPLKQFQGTQRLRILDLRGVGLGDEAVKEIARFPGLQQLNLFDASLTDEGLKPLLELTMLTEISLVDTRVRGQGLKSLENNKDLSSMTLGSEIGISDLTSLEALPGLRVLVLQRTASDEVLEQLVQLKQLTGLYLSIKGDSDAGLKHLAMCQNLTTLKLVGQQYSKEAVLALVAALPHCEVHWDGVVQKPE
jgi:serine/threonine protein kinase